MRISRGQQIAGFDAPALRKALRRLADHDFYSEAIDGMLGPGATEALRAEGLVEVVGDAGGAKWWRTTIAGNALAMAKLGKPYKRATALKALDAFLERALAVNHDHPEFMFSVARVELFGSILDESAEEVSDVDLVLELRARWTDHQEWEVWSRQRRDATERHFSDLLDRMGWPETEVRQFLKGRSPVLSFCRPDGVPPDAERRVIFKDEIGS